MINYRKLGLLFLQSAFIYLLLHLLYISRSEGSILAIRQGLWVFLQFVLDPATHSSQATGAGNQNVLMTSFWRGMAFQLLDLHCYMQFYPIPVPSGGHWYGQPTLKVYMNMHTSTCTLVQDMHTEVLCMLPIVFHDCVSHALHRSDLHALCSHSHATTFI